MAEYKELRSRLEAREIILLDGAIGTQLQSMGVPMDNDAWCALALETHPFTIRRMYDQSCAGDWRDSGQRLVAADREILACRVADLAGNRFR